MLTDIFDERYKLVEIWKTFGEAERRLLVQAYRIVSEDLFPFYDYKGNKDPKNEGIWKYLNSALSRELGYETLSAGWQGTYQLTAEQVCRNFVLGDIGAQSADAYLKQRMSFIELAFRQKEAVLISDFNELAMQNEKLLNSLGGGFRVPGTFEEGWAARKANAHGRFESAVTELNERFVRSGSPLNYHAGFIQRLDDAVTAVQIEEPFWPLLAESKWNNVSTDMKEALDRRDNGDRDPALYAAKALESAIKVIAHERKWTTGSEKGAHSYIDDLASERSDRFIAAWEAQSLKGYFTNVRNPLGHGPGNEPMPSLTGAQTSWAIEFAMIWIKALVGRTGEIAE